jgi:transposase
VTHPRVLEEELHVRDHRDRPHKSTHTAVAIDADEQPLARLRVTAGRAQAGRLLEWAAPLADERSWAIESTDGLGKLLAQHLLAAGEHLVDVPPP